MYTIIIYEKAFRLNEVMTISHSRQKNAIEVKTHTAFVIFASTFFNLVINYSLYRFALPHAKLTRNNKITFSR